MDEWEHTFNRSIPFAIEIVRCMPECPLNDALPARSMEEGSVRIGRDVLVPLPGSAVFQLSNLKHLQGPAFTTLSRFLKEYFVHAAPREILQEMAQFGLRACQINIVTGAAF